MKSNERRSTSILKKIISITLSFIFLAIQILFYVILLFGINSLKDNQVVYKVIYSLVELMGILIVLSIYNRDINQGYKLSWTIFILLCPFFGTMCYLLFGNSRTLSKKKTLKITNYLSINDIHDKGSTLDSDSMKIVRNLVLDSNFIPYKNTKCTFYKDASLKHQAMLNDIKNAKEYIYLEYFIISEGKLLNELIDLLIERAKDGVEIKIIYDDIGSRPTLKKKTIKKLNEIPNIKMVAYEPLGININPCVNYRDHRKIAIIDGVVAYCGGDNLADEYVHLKTRFGFWRDNALRLNGDAVYSYLVMFASTWYMSTREEIEIQKKKRKVDIKDDSIVLPFGDGPLNKNNPSYELYMNLINNAKKSLYISTPYFIIDTQMIEAIARAARNGIDVRILIPHVPDKKTVFLLSKSNLGPILASGGKVYEYTPGFNHAKNFIVDSKYAFIGTTNVDYRSLFLHFECGTLLIDSPEVKKMEDDFLDAVDESMQIDYEMWQNRSTFEKIIELILNIISPIL